VKLHPCSFTLANDRDTVANVTASISPEVATRPLFIINPMSGGGRAKKRIGAVVDAIERAGMAADLVFTQHKGHGTELAREAIEAGREFLVGCGGDGTVYEVANAILGMGAGERVRISTIGLGTGKDVAKCLGMGRGGRAISAIAAGQERRVDAGKVTSIGEDGQEQVRYFLLEASAGWVPEISQGTPRLLKRLGDTAPYMIMAGVKMIGPLGRQFTLSIDGNRFDGRYNSISVHNMELWGGDLVAAPGAAPDDGILDVIRWGDLSRRMAIKVMDAQRKGGTHVDFDGIDRHPAKVVELSSPKRSFLDLDGEHGGYLPAKIEIVPRALRFVAPPMS
jgi:YegS/Rv2252/BmrU family lipid kinase